MKDSKAPGLTLKGRKLNIVGITGRPAMWIIFDEPDDYEKDEQDKTCKTYHYDSKLHVLTAFNKIVKAYKRSKKDNYKYAIKLRGTKHNV